MERKKGKRFENERNDCGTWGRVGRPLAWTGKGRKRK